MSDVGGGKKCKNTALYVHVCSTCVSKAIFREKGSKLFLLKVRRKSEHKSPSVPEEKQEFSHSAGLKNKGDSWFHVSLVGRCPKGTKGWQGGGCCWTYAQSRWTSARQIGQVRLACEEPRRENKIRLMLLFLLSLTSCLSASVPKKRGSSLTLSHLSTHLAWNS